MLCNGNHWRLMRVLSALPPLWRFLQCIRRYKDTRNILPHLVNCGKYGLTVMSVLTPSLYRISGTHGNLALFIALSVINSIYCCKLSPRVVLFPTRRFQVFSGLMDQVINPQLSGTYPWTSHSSNRVPPPRAPQLSCPQVPLALLRCHGRRPRPPLWLVVNAIFTHDRQHSTLLSFLAALLKIVRGGIWAVFRVENEHCANISRYKASRDVL